MAFRTGDAGSPSAAPIIGANKVVITDSGGVLTGDPVITVPELETLAGSDTGTTIQTQLDTLDTTTQALTNDVSSLITDVIDLQNNKQDNLPNFANNQLLKGDGTNVPASVPNGTNGQLMTLVGGVPTWQTSVNPTLPNFDNNELLLGQGTQTPKTLDNGSNGQLLTITAGAPAWVNPANPTLPNFDNNELLLGQGTQTPKTLDNGSNGQILQISGGVPTWQYTSAFTPVYFSGHFNANQAVNNAQVPLTNFTTDITSGTITVSGNNFTGFTPGVYEVTASFSTTAGVGNDFQFRDGSTALHAFGYANTSPAVPATLPKFMFVSISAGTTYNFFTNDNVTLVGGSNSTNAMVCYLTFLRIA